MTAKYDNRKNLGNADHDIVLYETARDIAVKVLNRVDRTDSYLDKVLEFELRSPDLSRVDKAFLTELVNGTIRWKLKLDYVITQFYRGDFSKVDINIKNDLRVAVYQLLFLDKIPESAIVNQAVEFVKKYRGQDTANQINAVLRCAVRKIKNIEYPAIDDDPVKSLSTLHSFPAWLVRRFIDRFGVYETEQLLTSLNERPRLCIRVNTLRGSVEQLTSELEDRGVLVERGRFVPNFLYVEGLTRIGENEAFRAGRFVVQDESAGIVSILLAPKPGERILDTCAAPGGKAAHIFELTCGNVDLTCLEKYEVRATLLKSSLERMGFDKAKVIVADAASYDEAVPFDRILVDVPCTGFGLIRRKPDSKWKREREDIRQLGEIQSSILENASKLLKKDGVIVYSTSTIEWEENQATVNTFLKCHPEFVVESADSFVDHALVGREGFIEIFPHRHDMDGAFAARLRKVS
ncbi:MAG TPA: 16S rRNA (cytosine(967)-C(5))-methyltransferase RsmB [Candidatus Acidoferrales bacterium]|nr:16S rRNA (cytosine(967)-C(5))-methyltransferase RsmB [Candidatus Acidoferrales bacterium]